MAREFGVKAWEDFCKMYPHFSIQPHKADSAEVNHYYDELVAKKAKQWGETNFWTESARKYREKMLAEYAKGEAVPIADESRHYGHGSWGEDIELKLYSDGSFDYSQYVE